MEEMHEDSMDGSLDRQTAHRQLEVNVRKMGMQNIQNTSLLIPRQSEEERRRNLKKCKIKVTVINRPPERRSSHEDERIMANAAMAGKKAYPQILPLLLTSFAHLRSKYGISRRLAVNLDAQGYREPSEVQMSSLPLLLGTDEDRGLSLRPDQKSGTELRADVDLLTIAPTGNGKTLAYMIHILHGLIESRQTQNKTNADTRPERNVQALIIAPTHELADQILNEGKKLASGTGIRISGLRKGMRLHPNLVEMKDDALESVNDDTSSEHSNDFLVKTEIVVSTPLLCLHAISAEKSAIAPLPDIRFLILDEADVLLDPLFREQTLDIWAACTNTSLRTSFWSATLSSSVESRIQDFILDRRRTLGLTSSSITQHNIIRLVIGLKNSAIPSVAHRLIYTASERGKLLALRQLLHPSGAPAAETPSLQPPFLIFMQTISRAIALHSELLYDIPLEAGGSSRIAVVHSDLSDSARSNIMAKFRKGETWILIATDLLSRGIDFRGLNGVINYDIPNTSAAYVHRIGRTGRQGRYGGVAITLYTKDDIPYMKNVANVIAASQSVKEQHLDNSDGDGIQKWLLDALPDVSKETKKDMKTRGVESRRVSSGAAGVRGARRMRISTKSGYDRRLENRWRGVLDRNRKRLVQKSSEGSRLEVEEWEGIND